MKTVWNVIKFTCTVYVIGVLVSVVLITALRGLGVDSLSVGIITGAVVSCLLALLLFIDLVLLDEV